MLSNKKILNTLLNQKFEKPNPIDHTLNKIFLWAFPTFIKPNHLTLFRYFSTPIIFYLLLYHYYFFGLIFFSISALTDALDGAMARIRKKITNWGKIHDPLADKIFIGATGSIVIVRYLNLEIFLTIIFLELITILTAFFLYDRKNNPGAQIPGKIKMVFQTLGITLLIIYIITKAPILLTISLLSFLISIFFSFVNLMFCIYFLKSI